MLEGRHLVQRPEMKKTVEKSDCYDEKVVYEDSHTPNELDVKRESLFRLCCRIVCCIVCFYLVLMCRSLSDHYRRIRLQGSSGGGPQILFSAL